MHCQVDVLSIEWHYSGVQSQRECRRGPVELVSMLSALNVEVIGHFTAQHTIDSSNPVPIEYEIKRKARPL